MERISQLDWGLGNGESRCGQIEKGEAKHITLYNWLYLISSGSLCEIVYPLQPKEYN